MRWPLEAIWQAVVPGLPGFTAEVLPRIDSSNSELMRRFKASPGTAPRPEPTLLVAEAQTAGRGRLGRSWLSQRGDSLTFSLGMPLQPADWSGLSLAVGVSVADSLEPGTSTGKSDNTAPRIGLKWPNDVWLAGNNSEKVNKGEPDYSKLAGILVETASWQGLRYVVIGVGINICALELPARPPPDMTGPLPASAPLPPGHLQALLPELDAAQTLLHVVPPLVQTVQAFEQFGFAPFQARFARRDVLSGRAVALSDGTVGTACGVSDNGALLVHTLAGMKEVTSSEVSVRPC
ncbi:MAG: biotin--[acetyl-CoA-carboxylase] ligase [Polaromonas sp.]|nr:MAG: biotin--[acetyl-CoA-carboxylase] ligase [Polaromonas sp.]